MQDKDEKTALHWTVIKVHTEIVGLLLNYYNVQIHLQNKGPENLVHWASQETGYRNRLSVYGSKYIWIRSRA